MRELSFDSFYAQRTFSENFIPSVPLLIYTDNINRYNESSDFHPSALRRNSISRSIYVKIPLRFLQWRKKKKYSKYHFRIVAFWKLRGDTRDIYIYILYIFIVVDEIEESAKKKTKAELNKTKGSKRDGRPRGGWRARVCATVSERGLFKEATCVRETRELVCRLPTDKSVARAFFNCVPPTPAPCPPPFNSSPTDTFHVAPLFLSFFYFLFLFFFFVLSESVLSEYRSTYPKDVGVSSFAKQGRFYGFSIEREKRKECKFEG